MKIITSEVDAGLNEANRVVPGVGEFGDQPDGGHGRYVPSVMNA